MLHMTVLVQRRHQLSCCLSVRCPTLLLLLSKRTSVQRHPPKKAQLRAQLLSKIQLKGNTILDAPASNASSSSGGGCAGGLIPALHPHPDQSAARHLSRPPQQQQHARIWRAAMDALVADHLAAYGHGCSLSVFAAEAALSEAGALGREDVLALLRLGDGHPATANALQRLAPTGGAFVLWVVTLCACVRVSVCCSL